jgi:hypothetical protein
MIRSRRTKMLNEGFIATIPQGVETGDGHVELTEGTVYTLRLENRTLDPCDANVRIDGKEIICVRILANQVVELERPLEAEGRFTFHLVASEAGRDAELDRVTLDQQGLIEVTFQRGSLPLPIKPAIDELIDRTTARLGWWLDEGSSWVSDHTEPYTRYSTYTPARNLALPEAPQGIQVMCNQVAPAAGSTRWQAGGTGLTGHSSQSYQTVEALVPKGSPVTIALRLVGVTRPRVTHPLKGAQ